VAEVVPADPVLAGHLESGRADPLRLNVGGVPGFAAGRILKHPLLRMSVRRRSALVLEKQGRQVGIRGITIFDVGVFTFPSFPRTIVREKPMTECSRKLWEQVVVILALLWSATSAPAYPGRALRLPQLVTNADAIAVVDITDVRKTGEVLTEVDGNKVRADVYTSTAHLQRAIKGTCPDQFTIRSFTPLVFVGVPGIAAGIQIVFLKNEKGEFLFADPHYPSFPAVAGSNLPMTSGVDPVQEVAQDLVAVIASPNETLERKWSVFRVMYAIPTSDGLVSALRIGLQTTADSDLRYRIQAELISRDELSTLPDVEKLLLTNALPKHEKDAFLFVIANELKDPKALGPLQRLLRSVDCEVRAAAAEGLWHIASPLSSPGYGNSEISTQSDWQASPCGKRSINPGALFSPAPKS